MLVVISFEIKSPSPKRAEAVRKTIYSPSIEVQALRLRGIPPAPVPYWLNGVQAAPPRQQRAVGMRSAAPHCGTIRRSRERRIWRKMRRIRFMLVFVLLCYLNLIRAALRTFALFAFLLLFPDPVAILAD